MKLGLFSSNLESFWINFFAEIISKIFSQIQMFERNGRNKSTLDYSRQSCSMSSSRSPNKTSTRHGIRDKDGRLRQFSGLDRSRSTET